MMLHPTQELEPPANPERFNMLGPEPPLSPTSSFAAALPKAAAQTRCDEIFVSMVAMPDKLNFRRICINGTFAHGAKARAKPT
ncbi:hypothetical protein U716_10685 [Rhodobacter capsulatus B6]|nr:hypothetical protein U716_10685 [Rhodobacter capsulatus B6]